MPVVPVEPPLPVAPPLPVVPPVPVDPPLPLLPPLPPLPPVPGDGNGGLAVFLVQSQAVGSAACAVAACAAGEIPVSVFRNSTSSEISSSVRSSGRILGSTVPT